ncbi:cupin domain-containing protein [Paraburkholderia rhizosphaerae]|uniref:Quercetin dioxygenase-like cupin family protein n=1 Tax=Paraburkholderia rhizosphaerae TaxID=480658 RepID=A0A4R8LIW1_9BURK|nr:cupin domain-containing protein [Paraburkholderia rhizosphaerae]TDY43298.1 quercetin dioxygenase-like cupin family protein [Paraburkholderia rhizosphaerae]
MKSHFLDDETITDNAIHIPAIGLDLKVYIEPTATQGRATLIETYDAPGFGPPIHRHENETEVFHVLQGRYLFEVNGERKVVQAGETLTALVGTTHRFVNIDDETSRMLVLISPGFDATCFFSQLRDVMADGIPDPVTLARLGAKWHIEFLGPPLKVEQ